MVGWIDHGSSWCCWESLWRECNSEKLLPIPSARSVWWLHFVTPTLYVVCARRAKSIPFVVFRLLFPLSTTGLGLRSELCRSEIDRESRLSHSSIECRGIFFSKLCKNSHTTVSAWTRISENENEIIKKESWMCTRRSAHEKRGEEEGKGRNIFLFFYSPPLSLCPYQSVKVRAMAWHQIQITTRWPDDMVWELENTPPPRP